MEVCILEYKYLGKMQYIVDEEYESKDQIAIINYNDNLSFEGKV